ncbi:hypothetical protein M6B38_281405 [Iris pallida]|uniref:Uncharacterized protein n=1 Tax=Iris pallida TaxID=29817 RepID=A0AAX6I362_IRIPA|nr:hypothetical protein M6B38_281405 [Iris pallida]
MISPLTSLLLTHTSLLPTSLIPTPNETPFFTTISTASSSSSSSTEPKLPTSSSQLTRNPRFLFSLIPNKQSPLLKFLLPTVNIGSKSLSLFPIPSISLYGRTNQNPMPPNSSHHQP